MAETFAALLFAHVVADFVLQTRWMAEGKRRPGPAAMHAGVVLATAVTATGGLSWGIVALALAHLGIDLVKTHAGRGGIGSFLGDQAAHLATLVALAALEPGLWGAGVWSGHEEAPAIMALTAGLLVATRAGGFAVGLLMAPFAEAVRDGFEGLPGGGRMIGQIERSLVFLLIATGQAGGIGFLVAAKSVLRFGAVRDEARLSEYVIIGTMASFGWAIAAATATLWLLSALPPLGIPDLSP